VLRTASVRKRPPRQHGPDRGQGIVEFAIIFPVFILLAFIIIDFGLVMGQWGQMTSAAKEGARFASTGEDDLAAIVQHVDDNSLGRLEGATFNCPADADNEVCVEWIGGAAGEPAGEVGTWVKITARYQYNLITPIDGDFFGIATGMPGSFEIDSCSVVRLERPVNNPPSIGSDPTC
jgi:hypothetical protein